MFSLGRMVSRDDAISAFYYLSQYAKENQTSCYVSLKSPLEGWGQSKGERFLPDLFFAPVANWAAVLALYVLSSV